MAESRNVIVFLCDQLRPDFLSLYGCDAVPTPNLERLAKMGVVFDRAITQAPVCAPSRACMMTGRYVSDHGVWSNDLPFRDGLEYVAERFNAMGYATGAFGKLHHCPPDDAKGFQVYHAMEEGRLGDREPYVQWLKQRHPEVTGFWNMDGYAFRYTEKDYYEYWIASNAMEFFEQQTGAGRPFFGWVSFQGPHTPYDPPPEVRGTVDVDRIPKPLKRKDGYDTVPHHRIREVTFGLHDQEDIRARRIAYAEMIVAIDRQIGRVLDKIEALGQMDNTTFIFSADHGDLLGDFNLNEKGVFPYRGCLDVPMIVANHPDLPRGARSRSLVGTIDIPGTALAVAGDDQPFGVSRNMIELGRPDPVNPRTTNFSEFCDGMKLVENERYRFAYYPFTGRAELFDLDNDPDQLTNLADDPAYAPLRVEMMQHLLEYQLIAKGVVVEAHDMVVEAQHELNIKHPAWAKQMPIVFPLTKEKYEALKAAGLPADMNRFCEGTKPLNCYQPAYWEA